MADAGSRRGSSQGGPSGIGKQIEHIHRLFLFPLCHLAADKIPVGRLFGKDAGVFETHGLDLKSQIFIVNVPAFRQMENLPPAAALIRAVIDGIGLFPQGMAAPVPDGLGVRPDEDMLPPSFQSFSAAAIQQLIFLPAIGRPHNFIPLDSSFLYFLPAPFRRKDPFFPYEKTDVPIINLFYHPERASSMNGL